MLIQNVTFYSMCMIHCKSESSLDPNLISLRIAADVFVESRLQMALVDRIEQIKCRLDILFPPPILADNMNLEQRVSALVQNIQRCVSGILSFCLGLSVI